MANALYAKAKEKFLNPGTLGTTSGSAIDLIDDNIKILLVDANDYTVNLTTDEFHDDIPGGAIVATSGNLAGKSVTNGVFDATDVTLSTVTGDECEAIVIYKDTGTSSTSPLIAYIDTATGLPITPSGGDIIIVWDTSIFSL